MIKFTDIIKFNDINKIKIKFNQHNSYDDPLEVFETDPERINTGWFLWNEKKKYFKVGQIGICFVKMSYDKWLLTTIKIITKDLNVSSDISYEAEELDDYKEFFGRMIVKYHKNHTAQGVYLETVIDKLEVYEILPSIYDGDKFPGYDKVQLTFTQLESIIKNEKKDWKVALSNQKAVYLIRDKANGKIYVGSAYNDGDMLYQRWCSYVSNGHGGNKELKEVVNQEGIAYVRKNFVYSILENYNAKIDNNLIIARESWWKNILGTRTIFGYNHN